MINLDYKFKTELEKRNSQIYVIEGIDKSGKTTLAHELLRANHNSVYMKGNFKPRDSSTKSLEQLYDNYFFVLQQMNSFVKHGKTLILDRFFPSEMAYSYLRGKDNIDSGFLKSIDSYIADIYGDKLTIILCQADKITLEDRFLRDNENHASINDINELSRRYSRIFDSLQSPWMSYDTSAPNLISDNANYNHERQRNLL